MIEINRNPSVGELRRFALIWFPLFCLVVGLAAYRRPHGHAIAAAVWGAGAALMLAGAIRAAWVRPLFVGMSYATFPLGWVSSHLLLGALYLLVITPTGLLLRRIRPDRLGQKIDRSAGSYWIAREPPASSERYLQQY